MSATAPSVLAATTLSPSGPSRSCRCCYQPLTRRFLTVSIPPRPELPSPGCPALAAPWPPAPLTCWCCSARSGRTAGFLSRRRRRAAVATITGVPAVSAARAAGGAHSSPGSTLYQDPLAPGPCPSPPGSTRYSPRNPPLHHRHRDHSCRHPPLPPPDRRHHSTRQPSPPGRTGPIPRQALRSLPAQPPLPAAVTPSWRPFHRDKTPVDPPSPPASHPSPSLKTWMLPPDHCTLPAHSPSPRTKLLSSSSSLLVPSSTATPRPALHLTELRSVEICRYCLSILKKQDCRCDSPELPVPPIPPAPPLHAVTTTEFDPHSYHCRSDHPPFIEGGAVTGTTITTASR